MANTFSACLCAHIPYYYLVSQYGKPMAATRITWYVIAVHILELLINLSRSLAVCLSPKRKQHLIRSPASYV